MEKQNITLSLPKSLLKRVKVIAAQQEISVSALMERLLSEYVARQEGYQQAKAEHKVILSEGFELGTHGRGSWVREELHER